MSNTSKLTKLSLTSRETGPTPPSSPGVEVAIAIIVVNPAKHAIGFKNSADTVMGGDIDGGNKDNMYKDKDNEPMTDFEKRARKCYHQRCANLL